MITLYDYELIALAMVLFVVLLHLIRFTVDIFRKLKERGKRK
jgi:hypothetical protein